jgi:hypothetical protein
VSCHLQLQELIVYQIVTWEACSIFIDYRKLSDMRRTLSRHVPYTDIPSESARISSNKLMAGIQVRDAHKTEYALGGCLVRRVLRTSLT